MPKLPRVSGPELVKGLAKAGFQLARQRGSHGRLRHPDGRVTTVPLHARRDLPKGTLRAILRDTELTLEQLLELL